MALALVLLLAAAHPLRAHAQSYGDGAPPDAVAQAPASDAGSAEYLPQDQLDALLAPIALYPDDLLAQVLMASTYPLEVVEAARFVQQRPDLTGPALDDALAGKRWDPSVASLAAFPQVLAMMSDKLEWTQQLGDAFLANRAQVMDTVQALRTRAQAVGTLQDSDQQRVYDQDQSIVIEPAQPDVVYVPVYDPMVAYGPWWVPSYQPFFWYPPAFYGYPVYQFTTIVIFGRPCHVGRNHWGWAHPHWRTARIDLSIGRNDFFNRPRYRNLYRGANEVQWRHAPEHRHGVAYSNATVSRRYAVGDRRAVDVRRELRAGDPSRLSVRQPPRAVATPQGATAYRQAPSEPRAGQAFREAPHGYAPPAPQAHAAPYVAAPALPPVRVV
ncbi:MAG TPA: DUF3300 domain-containing protein, partial [Casimicrobiaceae bacterium]|nr:DUF3300 domain-containing protein [Casimicrobiaceae bacterium]